jgi:hypothetical protein
MLDVYVETYGALSKREKIDFILDQIRLCILKEVKNIHIYLLHMTSFSFLFLLLWCPLLFVYYFYSYYFITVQ